MKLKALLTGLLIGSLAMVGCSSDNDDPISGAKGAGTASKALMDGSDVAFLKSDGNAVEHLTGIKTAQGKFSYDKKAFDDATKPVKIVVSGGKIMGTEIEPATLTSYATEANANVNFGTTLAAALFDKLPASEKTAANAKQTLTAALDIVRIAAAPLLKGADEANIDVLMGATTAYSESVFLAALTSLGAVASGSAVSTATALQSLEANLLTILTSDKIIPTTVTMATLATASTTVTTSVTAADANIKASAPAMKAVYKNNADQIANAGLSTKEEVKQAEVAVDKGELPVPPANTPDPMLSNGWVFEKGGNQAPIQTWYVNNSSTAVVAHLVYRGGLSSTVPMGANNGSLQQPSGLATAVISPALTGLTSAVNASDKTQIDFTFDSKVFTNASYTANVLATFDKNASAKTSAGTLNIPFTVIVNGSSDMPSGWLGAGGVQWGMCVDPNSHVCEAN